MLLLSQLAGVALLVLVALDAFQTVLLPSARGWLNEAWVRLLWSGARILPTGIGRRARSSVGPLSIVATVASWVALLWVGYALIYLPDVDSLGFSSDVRFEGSDWVAALYLSGTVLTTLGLGDVAAQTDGLRLLVVLESAGGLGIFTAALGYLPAIYTVVSELRTSAEAVSDLRATTPESSCRPAAGRPRGGDRGGPPGCHRHPPALAPLPGPALLPPAGRAVGARRRGGSHDAVGRRPVGHVR